MDEFVAACQAAMAEDAAERIRDADAFLRQTSWDGTWAQMRQVISAALSATAEPVRAASAI